MSFLEHWAAVDALTLVALVAFIAFGALGALDPDATLGVARARARDRDPDALARALAIALALALGALALGTLALVGLALVALTRDLVALGALVGLVSALVALVGTLGPVISRAVRTASSRNLPLPNLSIRRPPGAWLLRLADSICRQSTSRLVLEMVADMRLEYFEALKDGRKVKARWIKALHYVAMARALTLDRLLAAGLSYVIGAFRTGKS